MSIETKLVAAALAVLCASAASAQITLYGREHFRGRVVSANEVVPDLKGTGLDDRVSSLSIRSGMWQLCSEPNFRGSCVSAGPGDYATLNLIGLDTSIASVRRMSAVAERLATAPVAEGVVLFEGPSFAGRSLAIEGPTERLDRFNDRARSMIVYDGQWELCEQDRYRGDCATFGPGRHANLGRFAGELSSLRPLEARTSGAPVGYVEGPNASAPSVAATPTPPSVTSAVPPTGTAPVAPSIAYAPPPVVVSRPAPPVVISGSAPLRSPDYGNPAPPQVAAFPESPRFATYPATPPHATQPARVVVYEGPNFRGRATAIAEDLTADLRHTSLDERAASLRVEAGSWILCSDPNFQGQCWTFGPGEYPTLPAGLQDHITSARRVPDDRQPIRR